MNSCPAQASHERLSDVVGLDCLSKGGVVCEDSPELVNVTVGVGRGLGFDGDRTDRDVRVRYSLLLAQADKKISDPVIVNVRRKRLAFIGQMDSPPIPLPLKEPVQVLHR